MGQERPSAARVIAAKDRYSITSSARASSNDGMVRSSAFGRLEIGRELKLRWLQHWQVSRLLAFENATDIVADLVVSGKVPVWTVETGNQAELHRINAAPKTTGIVLVASLACS